MSKRRTVDRNRDADRALFEEAVGAVRRISSRTADMRRPRPAPQPRQSEADEARVVEELMDGEFDPATMEVGEEITYLREGCSPKLLKRLRRGSFAVRDEIDLHQMNAKAASSALRAYLDECRNAGRLCVKIVHGKGLRSRAAGPVLKRMTDSLLRRRSDVLAFASARPAQGGTGATLVLLSAPR